VYRVSKESERRLADREITRLRARVFSQGYHVAVVDVLDLSPRGARIECTFDTVIPDRFVLRFDHRQEEIEARVVWRSGYDLGIRFVPARNQAWVAQLVPVSKPFFGRGRTTRSA
jgi:hypothetical protein